MWGEIDEVDSSLDEAQANSSEESNVESVNTFFRSDEFKDDKERSKSTDHPILLTVIELLQYKRYMQRKRIEGKSIGPVPDLPNWRSKEKASSLSDELLEHDTHDVLRKSMASLVAYAGFDDIEDEALESLADIVGQCLQRLCTLIAILESRPLSHSNQSISIHSVVRALKLIGIPHPWLLLQDYDSRIRRYHIRLLKQCKQLKFEQSSAVKGNESNSTPSSNDFMAKDEMIEFLS